MTKYKHICPQLYNTKDRNVYNRIYWRLGIHNMTPVERELMLVPEPVYIVDEEKFRAVIKEIDMQLCDFPEMKEVQNRLKKQLNES